MTLIVLVDGEPSDVVPVTDSSVLRGDGCFEAIRSYGGHCFRLEDHLDRLERSAAALRLSPPDRSALTAWVEHVADQAGDAIVRVVLTRGPAVPGAEGVPHCIVLAHPVPAMPAAVRLLPVVAPWHPAGRAWELAGAKTISYAPNLAASRRAVEEGYDDALLVSDSGVVLEGPTFSVGWVRAGRIATPSLGLGILDSITRRVALEVVDSVTEVEAHLDDLTAADEVFVLSTVKEVTPVAAVGQRRFEAGPVTAELAQLVGASSSARH